MLENKVLINLYVLTLDKRLEIFIPVNEKIGNISKLLNTTLFDSINYNKSYIIMDVESGKCYENNVLVRDTNIKNGTRLILV